MCEELTGDRTAQMHHRLERVAQEVGAGMRGGLPGSTGSALDEIRGPRNAVVVRFGLQQRRTRRPTFVARWL